MARIKIVFAGSLQSLSNWLKKKKKKSFWNFFSTVRKILMLGKNNSFSCTCKFIDQGEQFQVPLKELYFFLKKK